MLSGGADRDTFSFAWGHGYDVVTDLVVGTDRLDLRAMELSGTDALLIDMVRGSARVRVDANGDGRADTTDVVILNGVDAASLGAGDFLF